MPYGDLLLALEAEVREQRLAIEEEARREAARIEEEGRRLSARAREEALARAAEQAEALRDGARRRAAAREARAVLLARDEALAGVRRAVAERLPSRSTPALTIALLAEALADDDGSTLVVTCDPGHAAACRDWLARERPDAAPRATVVEAPAVRGGVEVAVGPGLVVDDTLPSRLQSAWPALCARLGPMLFGGNDA